MILSKSRWFGLTALVGVFLLLSATSPVSLARDVSDLPPDASGNVRTPVEADADRGTPIWKVIADAIDEGVLALEPVRFWLSGGDTLLIEWIPRVGRTQPIDAGIIVDDGVPF